MIVALVAAGCGGDDGRGGLSMAAVLDEIPASAISIDAVDIRVVDVGAVAELADVDRGALVDGDELTEWGRLVGFGATEPDGPRRVSFPVTDFVRAAVLSADEVSAELGWSFEAVDRLVDVRSGADSFVLASLDVASIDRSREDDDGVIRLGTGDDGEFDPTGPTELRPVGFPLRMVVDDARSAVAVSTLTPAVEDWRSGPDETAADVDDLTVIAALLDREGGTYSGEIKLFGDGAPDGAAVGVGVAHAEIGDDQRTTVVVLFRDDADATAALADLEASGELPGFLADDGWAFGSESFEVDGRGVVARGVSR